MINILELYNKELKFISKKFAEKTPKSRYLDEDDYYHEALIFLLSLTKNPKVDIKNRGYVVASLKNHLEKIHKTSCTVFTNTPYIMDIYYQIQKLKNQNYTDEEIQEDLNINSVSYWRILNLLNTTPIETKDVCNDKDEIEVIFSEILHFITKEERYMLELCVRDFSLSQIAATYGRSHEWARIQIISLFDKIRSYYDE